MQIQAVGDSAALGLSPVFSEPDGVSVEASGADGVGTDDTSRRFVVLPDTGVEPAEVSSGEYVEAVTSPVGTVDELPPVELALEEAVEGVDEDVVSSIQTAIGSSSSCGAELDAVDTSINDPLLSLVLVPTAESEDAATTWCPSTDDEVEPSVLLLEGRGYDSLVVMAMSRSICPLVLVEVDPADGTEAVGIGSS